MNLVIFFNAGLFILSNLLHVDSLLSDFDSFKDHEIINMKVEFGRESQEEQIVSNEQFVFVKFRAFGKKFRLSLQEDESILSPETKIFIRGNRKIIKMYPRNIPQSSVYKGIVDGKNDSYVSGFFSNKAFYGIIQTTEHDYHLEPASLHYKQQIYRDKVIIYSINNLHPDCKFINGKYVCQKAKDQHFRDNYGKFYPYKGNVSSENMRLIEQKKICSLEVLADHTYFEYFNKNSGEVIAEILLIINMVGNIFRYADIDGDGSADGIGFLIEKITIFENADEPGYPLGKKSNNADQFLEYLTEYNHSYCFLICFTHRSFCTETNCVIKKTTEATSKIGDLGGICPVHHKSVIDNIKRSHNVGFISNLVNETSLPRTRVIMNILHMMGHAFGCSDDPINDLICSPGNFDSNVGNFIMYPIVPFADKPNSLKYSPCCLNSMKRFLKIKGTCLKTSDTSKCGNGIVEEGEECDCGSTQQICDIVNHCCIPKGSLFQCSLRQKNFCSPDRGQCCDRICIPIIAEVKKECYVYTACRIAIAYCDGISPFCPETIVKDGTPCMGTSKTCKNGDCTSDICQDKNLKPCICSSIQDECHICCLSSNGCQTAVRLNLTYLNHQLYLRYPGTYCNNEKGICSSNGTCKIVSSIYNKFEFWIINPLYLILLLPYVIYTVFAMTYFYYNK